MKDLLRIILNVIWLVTGGFLMYLGYLVAGVLCYIFVVTIPFGTACFRIARYVLWPFGSTTEEIPTAGAGSAIGNVIWLVIAGWWLTLGHIITALTQTVSIVGIPCAIASFKLIPVSLMPLGRRVVPTDSII